MGSSIAIHQTVETFNVEDLSRKETVLKSFNDNRVIVFANVLTPEEISQSIDSIKMERENSQVYFDRMPGFINNCPLKSDQAWHNRQHPKIIKIFQTLYDNEDLVSLLDRGYCGTEQVKLFPHRDCSFSSIKPVFDAENLGNMLLSEANNCETTTGDSHIRAVLCLTRSSIQDGGFACSDTETDKVSLVQAEPGSIILFRASKLHSPVSSKNGCRVSQYLRMAERTQLIKYFDSDYILKRDQHVEKLLPEFAKKELFLIKNSSNEEFLK